MVRAPRRRGVHFVRGGSSLEGEYALCAHNQVNSVRWLSRMGRRTVGRAVPRSKTERTRAKDGVVRQGPAVEKLKALEFLRVRDGGKAGEGARKTLSQHDIGWWKGMVTFSGKNIRKQDCSLHAAEHLSCAARHRRDLWHAGSLPWCRVCCLSVPCRNTLRCCRYFALTHIWFAQTLSLRRSYTVLIALCSNRQLTHSANSEQVSKLARHRIER